MVVFYTGINFVINDKNNTIYVNLYIYLNILKYSFLLSLYLYITYTIVGYIIINIVYIK